MLRLLSFLALGCTQPPQVSAVSSLEDVFPDGPATGAPRAELEAARGEWESFQIVVRAGSQSLHGVSAAAAIDVPHWLYRVGYVEVRTPSSIEGHKGPWPDILIPDVDSFVGEKRNAFPFDVPRGEARAIWVELFVPPDARAGLHAGEVRVRFDGREQSVPITLAVHRFALPKTSSIPVTFGFAANALEKVHGKVPDVARLAYWYGVSALRHRISLHGGTFEPPTSVTTPDGNVQLDFTAYDAEVGPFLDGTADRGGPAFGAKFSAIDLRVAWRLQGDVFNRYTRAVIDHFRKRGWFDRLFDYTFDEPPKEKVPQVRARADRVHRVAPEVPRLVTRELNSDLAGSVDIWCPTVNLLDDKPGNTHFPARSAYPRIWWYQACMSHGCDIVGGQYFTGWPSLVVDTPPAAQRILEWLTFRYQIGGELYFNTVEAYTVGLDPFVNQHLHGGNGDGTLFYPGSPAHIGGRTHIPVESIRLARIRDGLEDYEYLTLYAARFGKPAALRIAERIAPRTFEWEHKPAKLLDARHRMAHELDEKSALLAD
jgi:hypothetical protein